MSLCHINNKRHLPMFIKRITLVSVLALTISLLPARKVALGAEATYSPALLTVGDSTSLLSDTDITLFISYKSGRLCCSSSFSFEKEWEHQSFHRFSRLNEISSIAFSSSIGYLIRENLSLNADIGIKLIAIGVPPNNIRALSPCIGIIIRKEFLSTYNTPCFSIFIPFEFTFGKTVKGVSLGIGIGYFFSLPKVENK